MGYKFTFQRKVKIRVPMVAFKKLLIKCFKVNVDIEHHYYDLVHYSKYYKHINFKIIMIQVVYSID